MTRLKKWRETAIRAATCKRSKCGGDTAAVARARAHYKGDGTRERVRARVVALSLRRQHIKVWQSSCSRSHSFARSLIVIVSRKLQAKMVCSLIGESRRHSSICVTQRLHARARAATSIGARFRATRRPQPPTARSSIDSSRRRPPIGLTHSDHKTLPSHEGQTPFVAHRRVRRPQKRQLQRQRRRQSLTMRARARTFVIRRTSEKARARVRLHSRCV